MEKKKTRMMRLRRLTRKLRGKLQSGGFASFERENTLESNADLDFEDYFEVSPPMVGNGSYGSVWKCFKKTESWLETDVRIPFAAKIVDKSDLDEESKKSLQFEIEALTKLRHPNIISFYDRFEKAGVVTIVTEYIAGGTLKDWLQEGRFFSESTVRQYMFQLLSALDHCSEVGVVHRDIKPSNILVTVDINDQPLVKLIDFGFSAVVDLNEIPIEDHKFDSWMGTLEYASPELVNREPYNFKTDFWSLGVLMFELLSNGTKPFTYETTKRGSKKRMQERICRGEFKFEPKEEWRHVSSSAKDLLQKFLLVDVKSRFSSKEGLRHLWIADNVFLIEPFSRLMRKPPSSTRKKIVKKVAEVVTMESVVNEFEKLMEESKRKQSDLEEDVFSERMNSKTFSVLEI